VAPHVGSSRPARARRHKTSLIGHRKIGHSCNDQVISKSNRFVLTAGKRDHAFHITCPLTSVLRRTILRRPKARKPSSSTRTYKTPAHLSREGSGEALHVVLQRTVVAQELDISTVHQEVTGSLLLQVLLAAERGETPVLGDDDLLATGELVLGAAESLESGSLVCSGC
jgi:hypothetical protein